MTFFRWLASATLALCLAVVVFGAYVRLSHAGLGCPDWPGCYGQLSVPESAPDTAKAWKEMIHRYLASGLGLSIAGLALLSRAVAAVPRRLPWVLVALVIFQGVLGMWTVTLLLKPIVVTAHLLGGMTTLALLAWLTLSAWRAAPAEAAAERSLAQRLDPHAAGLRNEREAWRAMQGAPPATAPAGVRFVAAAGLLLLALQIFLGGWTSSNYAALACPDLPTCQGRGWPELDVKEAFTLWRGLGVNYEHGVLDNRARVTIHHLHRVGALVTSAWLVLLGALLVRRGAGVWRRFGVALFTVLGAQALLGMSLVLLQLPLPLAAAHNAGAALLVLVMVSLAHFAWRPPA